MFYALLLIMLGLAGLVWGGDRFVAGASALARHLGVSPLLIGLTIVGFGTSAPEIFVAIMAAIHGNTGIAIGNAIGSNIANVGLVLGVTAVFMPISIHSKVITREFPVLFVIMVFVLALLWEGWLGRVDGLILLLGMIVVLTWIIWVALRQDHDDQLAYEFEQELMQTMSISRALVWIVVGLVLLPVSSELMVQGAVIIAKLFHVSDLIIGLTVVAIGTSLPELFTSLLGVIKNEPDIAIGNILGSNMFNLLAVLGFAGLIHPIALQHMFYWRDYPVMVALSVILYVMCIGKRRTIARWHGAILLMIYIGYLCALVTTALSKA